MELKSVSHQHDPDTKEERSTLTYTLDSIDKLRYMIHNRCLNIPNTVVYNYQHRNGIWIDADTYTPAPPDHLLQIMVGILQTYHN